LHAFLARQLAEQKRQNEKSEMELLWIRAMIASQRTEIEALQREDSDLKEQIQSLQRQDKFRMASYSSN
jgi:predicted RNase H-like nuclease (RuvC/YqgF family)